LCRENRPRGARATASQLMMASGESTVSTPLPLRGAWGRQRKGSCACRGVRASNRGGYPPSSGSHERALRVPPRPLGFSPARKSCRQRSLTIGVAVPPIRSITIVESWAKWISLQGYGIGVWAFTGGDGRRLSIGIGRPLRVWWPCPARCRSRSHRSGVAQGLARSRDDRRAQDSAGWCQAFRRRDPGTSRGSYLLAGDAQRY
jgi:hypothetical protein